MGAITKLAHIPIFNRSVFFVGNCKAAKAIEKVYQLKKKKTQVWFDEGKDGQVVSVGGDIFCWVKDLNRSSIVAHELAHVACSIMEECGVPQCRETEEVMCYLIQWLKLYIQDPVYIKFKKMSK